MEQDEMIKEVEATRRRQLAVEMALGSMGYSNESKDPDKVLEIAKKFDDFLAGKHEKAEA